MIFVSKLSESQWGGCTAVWVQDHTDGVFWRTFVDFVMDRILVQATASEIALQM